MKTASLIKNLEYKPNKPAIQVLLNTESTKEIRIAMKKDQVMKEHKTPFPIIVEIFEGKVAFGVNGVINKLEKGDLVALEGNVPHDLLATEDSIIRLSLSIADTAGRVEDVANKSSK